MKTKIAGSVAAMMLGLVLTGCQAETTDSGLPTDFDFTETETETIPIEVVTVWAPSAVSESLAGIAGAFEEEYGVNVQFSNIELAEIQSRLAAGNYPDVFFGTHSWTADLVQSGVVAKINTGVLGSRVAESLKAAFEFEGSSYGVPVSEQHVSLVCNSELVPEQPDISDLEEVGLGLALDPQLGDPYHLYPFMSSFGLGLENPEETEFDSDAGYEFANWMTLTGSGLFDLESDYASVLAQFNAGEIGCWMTGPWAFASIDEQLEDSLVVYPVPSAGNLESSALIDVAGFFVAQSSDDPIFSNRLVLEYFTRSTSQLAVARSLSGIPAVETDNELLSQFAQTAINATPTPASDFMDQLWPVLGSTQAELIRNEESSVEIWTRFVTEFEALRGN